MATIVRKPSGLYEAQVCINGIRKAKKLSTCFRRQTMGGISHPFS